MNIAHYTDILWDFNGTILDDVEAGIRSVNKLLSERGLKEIADVEAYYSVFGFPIIDYYRRLGFDFEKESYEKIAPIWVDEYMRQSLNSGLRDGVQKLFEKFTASGLHQTVISMTEESMLKGQITSLGIEKYFDDVIGLDNIHAESKKKLAAKWRNENPDAVALFIGDTQHDAEVAKAIGADCLLVSGGHQSKTVLLQCGCPVADSVRDIESILIFE